MLTSSSSSARADRYVYQPLDHTRRQTRLIHLELLSVYDDPATSGPIECTMEIFDLDKAPPFTALSYTWGPAAPSNQMLVDGKPVTVRENLFQFLQEFRTTEPDPDNDSDEWLWIDQIGIDQSNVTERNQQVQMMSDIYHGAESVIVWLGIGDTRATFYEGTPDPRTMYEAGIDYRNYRDTRALGVVLRNDYFSRVWVVQEFLLAKRFRILIRDVWMLNSGDVANSLLGVLFEIRVPSVHGVNFFLKRDSLGNKPGARSFSFIDALISFRHTLCADPRDKIYGLLGLVRSEECVMIDYQKLPQQVLMDAVLVVFACDHQVEYSEHVQFVLIKPDSKSEMCRLALQMGCTSPQLSSLTALLNALWTPDRLRPFRGHPCPITEMGFEPANEVETRVDRWWFTFLEERYYVECMDAASVTSFNTKTANLLSESWDQYRPKSRWKLKTVGGRSAAWFKRTVRSRSQTTHP
jgi:hypothetical protein